jgi:hypothetical protein
MSIDGTKVVAWQNCISLSFFYSIHRIMIIIKQAFIVKRRLINEFR